MEQQRRMIRDVQAGDRVDQLFLIQNKELRRTPSGSTYVACRLSDQSGVIDARWWQATQELFDGIPEGGFACFQGRVHSHRGKLQLIVESMTIGETTAGDLSEFLPSTERDIEVMWAELEDHLRGVSNDHLRRLVDSFLADSDLIQRFKLAPAAVQLHHNVVGGLLEHTLDVVHLVLSVATAYGEALNRDLLLVGAFLHDIGKTEELHVGSAFNYTDRGNLVGHMTSAVIWIQQKADAISEERGEPFPSQIVDLLQHLVLSHHGTKERGSPKPPMIPEALVLHAMDDLDMRVRMARSAIEDVQDQQASFSAYHRHLDARIYRHALKLPGDGEG